MERALRILILEDLPSDAELMVYELRQAEIAHSCRRVADREPFVAALTEDWPDLILSDFHLPNFDGLEALALAQATCPDTPFIFVSGAMGEEVAIDAVKRGATDYVLKDRLSRLGPAVQRALREAEERRERRQAEAALRAVRKNTVSWSRTSRPWCIKAMWIVRWILSMRKWKNSPVTPRENSIPVK